MVDLGLLVMLGGTWHYIHVARSIDAETFHPARIGIVLTTLAVLLLGGVSLGWLLW
jgi:putative membrane protein